MKWWEIPNFQTYNPAWSSSTVLSLLKSGIEYAPMLADALEDAYCDDSILLNALRGTDADMRLFAYKHVRYERLEQFELNWNHVRELVEELLMSKLRNLRAYSTSSYAISLTKIVITVHWHHYSRSAIDTLREGNFASQHNCTFDEREIRTSRSRRRDCFYIYAHALRKLYYQFVEDCGVDLTFL